MFDGIEALSIEFNESDNNINIYLLLSTAVLYVLLFFGIFDNFRRGKDVYNFIYVFLFKCLSFMVAFIIFNTTSSFDRITIKQLYMHFAEKNFKDMFLTATNIVSSLDIILNFVSLSLLIRKILRAEKEGKGTFRELLYKRYDLVSKSDDGECEGPNQQSVFSVNVEYPNAAN